MPLAVIVDDSVEVGYQVDPSLYADADPSAVNPIASLAPTRA